MNGILFLFFAMIAVVLFVLLVLFVLVPVVRGVGWLIGRTADGIVWLIRHVYDFIAGVIQDTVRFVGSIPAMVAFSLLSMANIMIGRWSASGHFAESFRHELTVAGLCIYRVLLQRPLRLLLLDGLLEGIEQRVPAAMQYTPGSDEPPRRAGSFPGYTIVGSLPGGGSGAKLYIAEPDPQKSRRWPNAPEHVVIKSFALTDGSSLPQIVRESRALEAARKLGLVLDHQMEDHRFYYVMPYHPGDHLGLVARRLHSVSSVDGLDNRNLHEALGYIEDLLDTLRTYHAYGLWHKDVKPENLIVHDGRAHLVDLGLVTPLSSGMTLTTHGTEYFRDPELVRQALRGVKVHQVDGTKFDIYAAGAVLYFMIENTFPAHGGLSSIRRRCPEALRWVVRRAMTDYDKRYASVEAMLADLRAVRNAHDPFAVKPAALPSMRSAADEVDHDRAGNHDAEVDEFDDSMRSAAAGASQWRGSPTPPPPGRDRADVPERPAASSAAASVETPAHPQRPNLRVTNWWTGQYEPSDGDSLSVRPDEMRAAGATTGKAAKKANKAAQKAAKKSVKSAAKQAKRTARDQVRDARRRASATRARIASRPPRSPRSAAGSIAVAFVFFAMLVALVFAALPFTGLATQSTDSPAPTDPVAIPQHVQHATRPVLVIDDHPSSTNADVPREVEAIMTHLRDEYDAPAATDDIDAEAAIRRVMRYWQRGGEHAGARGDEGFAAEDLRDLLDEFDYAGIMRIVAADDDDDRSVDIMWIGFDAEDAASMPSQPMR